MPLNDEGLAEIVREFARALRAIREHEVERARDTIHLLEFLRDGLAELRAERAA